MNAAETSITNLGSRLTTAEGTISTHTTDINDLDSRLDTAEDNISDAQNDISDLQGDVTSLDTIVGNGQQTVGSDLTDAVTQLNSRLNVIGDGYALDSKSVTSVPSNTDTVIYGKVLPQGKYILSAKVYCNVSNASCYLMCGGIRQQLTCTNVAYMTLCGLVTSNGSTETQLHFYQNSGTTQTRTDNFDDVYLVRIL